MNGIVRGIEIEDNTLGRRRTAFKKQADKQPLQGLLIHAELAVAVIVRPRRMLKPVQRGLAREHRTVRPPRFKLAGEKTQHRIMAKRIVIVNQVNPISEPWKGRIDIFPMY
jgi:hypothetical protein